MHNLIAAFVLFVTLSAFAQDKPDEILTAVVGVSAKIQANARSAESPGLERRGTGALVREGYVLTIGYLVIEAESIQVTGADGRTVPATLAGYDHATGFGLLKLLGKLAGRPLALGDASALGEREPAMAVPASARDNPSLVYVVSRRPFTGSWEYLLDSAIFTYPPVMDWSGAPLIGQKGELLGLGSLIVPDAGAPGTQSPGNMFVPIAERAGLKSGDIVLAVGGEDVTTLADFYRRIWGRGAAGAEVPLKVLQGSRVRDVTVRSIDRVEYFRASKTY
jgi:serine protease Do